LTRSLPFEVRTMRLYLEMSSFYDPERRQYNSTALLGHLRQHHFRVIEKTESMLLVVPYDLYIPPLTFVFGEAELGGRLAVVSTCRLENERYGLRPDSELLANRIVKESMHEIGHMVGLTHCFEPHCAMRASTSVEEIDLKGDRYCTSCRALFPSTTPV
ncbi:MAG: archaemetzincin family Zn-dependent metalloprotease, partial [Ignavibacteria bacterium]|nr:archaemetzincin family Zn-dependent metalloprotease [Ignavibacteria bacterium]